MKKIDDIKNSITEIIADEGMDIIYNGIRCKSIVFSRKNNIIVEEVMEEMDKPVE